MKRKSLVDNNKALIAKSAPTTSQAMGAARQSDREKARHVCERMWGGFYDNCVTGNLHLMFRKNQ